ncbi:VCBS repeat-containing protein, partial [Patescibacteria group bacterium]|nr:VCBS repeat-containing protein [Patescibacteria group bacterium]
MGRKFFVIPLIILMAVGMFPLVSFAARGDHSAPKLLNLYLGWIIKDKDQKALAQWDLVVLDMDMQWQAPEKMRQLRKDNPRIKILAYVSAGELAAARGQGDRTSPGYRLYERVPESFFMHDVQGKRLSWWPGAHLMNATNLGMAVNGKRWSDVLPEFVRDEMMSTGLWDGVFLDAAYSDVTYFYGNNIDPDGNGYANSPAQTNEAWKAGMSRLIANMRGALGPNKIIMNNSSAAYASQVNGVLFENFPRFGWAYPFREFQTTIAANVRPSVTSINTNTNNKETPSDYRMMRYGLTSALLSNGYFSFDAGDQGHERTWWYDEYEASLGEAKGGLRRLAGRGTGVSPGVWMREFERGIVLVNSDTIPHRVTLPGTYEKLRGSQDKATNDGGLIRTITLPAQDGIILLGKPDATEVRDSSFVNGQFVSVYSNTGQQIRNGFFAQRTDVPSGSKLVLSDAYQNGSDVVVYAYQGAVWIKPLSGGTTRVIRPFGYWYRGDLNVAVGNTNTNTEFEIVVSRGRDEASDVKVYSLDGREQAYWQAYNPYFKGGVRVGIGDLDGDGLREIVTGAGPSGGPHIRIWKTDGKIWGGGFFAFHAHESGGVSVAVGDVDGDNRDEIVVGSGEGAQPRVRIFDFRGTLKNEFSLGTQPVLEGLNVSVADINGDNRAEILVSGIS